MIVAATSERESWTDARDCIVPGAETASMIHQNVTLNPRDMIQDDQSRQARATILRRVDQEAVLEVEVIPHLISATDLATVAKLSLFFQLMSNLRFHFNWFLFPLQTK